jgi:hypothetical protein
MSEKELSLQILLEKQRQAAAHRQRCRRLPPLRLGEAEQLVAKFLADRPVTQCPTVYLVPLR